MDKVEKAVIDLDGVWADDRFKGVLVWDTDGHKGDNKGYSSYYEYTPGFPSGQEFVCNYPEFMEARKRLENKPVDWPEWANWLAQDSDGMWEFYVSRPEPRCRHWGPRDTNQRRSKGRVFGDWHQSLEPRPHPDHKEAEGMTEREEAWHNVWDELKRFVPEICNLAMNGGECSIEAVRLLAKEAGRVNEEGEGVEWEPGVDLPPVDTQCLVTPAGNHIGEWYPCKVIAHYEGEAIFKPSGNFPLGPYPFMAYPSAHFKPIQSHRDKVIEAATEVGASQTPVLDSHVRAVVEALAEADMLKLPGDDQ